MQFKITATSKKALLMHNVQLANPLNPYAKELKTLNSKRVKSDEDREAIAQVEFLGSLYYDDDLGPVIPQDMLLASIITGARLDKLGKQVERAFVGFDDDQFPLLYAGPRTPKELWADKNFVDSRPAGVQGSKVIRTRPIFRSWGFEAVVEFDTEVMNPEEVERCIVKAGKFAGLGDYRKLFGRYSAKVEALQEAA